MKTYGHLLEKKLLLITGKGGTGKTLAAAALGQLAASTGKRVLLVESNPQEQIAPLFGSRPVGHYETRISAAIFGVNLDYQECIKEYVIKRLKMPALYHRVFERKVVRSFLNAIPGLLETMLLGRLYQTAKEGEYDLIIFDAPASGHFLSLIATPRAVMQSGLMGPLVGEVERVLNFLSDPGAVGIAVVAVPEELIVNETVELIPLLLKNSPAQLAGVLINRTFDTDASEATQLNTLEQNPKMQAAVEYLKRRIGEAIRNQAVLLDALKAWNLAESARSLPDLGLIQEPLSADFYRRYL